MYLILIDAHSKWLEVRPTNATSSATIAHLLSIFSVHGLPEVAVSDNETVLTGAEFEEFWKLNRIQHRTAPYHPASNGQAERAVKIFKQHIKKHSGRTTLSLDSSHYHRSFTHRIAVRATPSLSPPFGSPGFATRDSAEARLSTS